MGSLHITHGNCSSCIDSDSFTLRDLLGRLMFTFGEENLIGILEKTVCFIVRTGKGVYSVLDYGQYQIAARACGDESEIQAVSARSFKENVWKAITIEDFKSYGVSK